MAAEEGCPMKGGNGPNGYAKNSTQQKVAVDAAKEVVSKAIAEKLDLEMLLASGTSFRIADLGCSVGPNTFSAVEYIIGAVKLKHDEQSPIPLEFQVFFNDHTSNDFNLLFSSLPTKSKPYYSAGVPGSFYGRIFPKDSLHFVHSSISLHWLSRVPEAVTDRNSLAWNKGRIEYSHAPDEVISAFEAQFAEDMACFLNARAEEIVRGGLMALVVPGRLDSTPHSECSLNVLSHHLGCCLMDMARRGVISEDKVDGCNLPMYYTSPKELKAAVKLNGRFTIECVENIPRPNPSKIYGVAESAQLIAAHVRAISEGLFRQQFGDEMLDELYDLFLTKLKEQPSILDLSKTTSLIFVLERH